MESTFPFPDQTVRQTRLSTRLYGQQAFNDAWSHLMIDQKSWEDMVTGNMRTALYAHFASLMDEENTSTEEKADGFFSVPSTWWDHLKKTFRDWIQSRTWVSQYIKDWVYDEIWVRQRDFQCHRTTVIKTTLTKVCPHYPTRDWNSEARVHIDFLRSDGTRSRGTLGDVITLDRPNLEGLKYLAKRENVSLDAALTKALEDATRLNRYELAPYEQQLRKAEAIYNLEQFREAVARHAPDLNLDEDKQP